MADEAKTVYKAEAADKAEAVDKAEVAVSVADDDCNNGDACDITPNRGTGAGGRNTNKNGLKFEDNTKLESEYTIISKGTNYTKIKFNQNSDIIFTVSNQQNLFKYMKSHINTNVNSGHGCKRPDECFIDEKNKKINIIEKKSQRVSGSACEKIQTADFKLWQYRRTFPEFEITYIYVLSDWFKINCKAELKYLKLHNIKVFWGNKSNYKNKIVEFIAPKCLNN